MQTNLPPVSQWRDLWPYIVVALVTATVSIATTLLTRKRRSLTASEENKNNSEAELDRAQARDVEGRLSISLLEKLGETQRTIAFLEQELRNRGNLESIARNQKHAAIGEIERCTIVIRDHEEATNMALAMLDVLISDCVDEEMKKPLKQLRTQLKFTPFQLRKYRDIIGEDDIPLQPQMIEAPARLALPSAS